MPEEFDVRRTENVPLPFHLIVPEGLVVLEMSWRTSNQGLVAEIEYADSNMRLVSKIGSKFRNNLRLRRVGF